MDGPRLFCVCHLRDGSCDGLHALLGIGKDGAEKRGVGRCTFYEARPHSADWWSFQGGKEIEKRFGRWKRVRAIFDCAAQGVAVKGLEHRNARCLRPAQTDGDRCLPGK